MDDQSALKVYHDLTSPKKNTEQMRTDKKEETTVADKFLESVEESSNVPQGFCEGQLEPHQPPSSLSLQCNSKSTQKAEPFASTHSLQPDKTLDFLEEREKLALAQREAIKRRYPLKFIVGHYGSGKVCHHSIHPSGMYTFPASKLHDC